MNDIIINNLKHRGYEFLKSDNNIIFMKNKDEIILVFINNDILNMVNIKDYMAITNSLNVSHIIIVYKKKITPSTKKIINHNSIKTELFEENEISFDITKHKYYYPHIKVDDNTKKLLLKKYGNNLPIILKTDKVVKFLDFNKGDIIKILRKDNNIYYRIVK